MARYEISVLAGFAAAHNLRTYKGGCESLHGHNYRVQVTIGCDRLDGDGMVYDFKDLKRATKQIADRFDHLYINDVPPFTELNPTAENLSRYFHDEISQLVKDDRVKVTQVIVWETDIYAATYRPD